MHEDPRPVYKTHINTRFPLGNTFEKMRGTRGRKEQQQQQQQQQQQTKTTTKKNHSGLFQCSFRRGEIWNISRITIFWTNSQSSNLLRTCSFQSHWILDEIPHYTLHCLQSLPLFGSWSFLQIEFPAGPRGKKQHPTPSPPNGDRLHLSETRNSLSRLL